MYKVLLVDDEPWAIEDLKLLVDWNAWGFQIVGEQHSGDGVEKLVRNLAPDLLICDIRMPGTNGLELLEQLKQKFPLLATVFISAYSDFAYARKALQLGAADFMLKPVSAQQLTETLQKMSVTLQFNSQKQKKISWAEQTELFFDLMEGGEAEWRLRDRLAKAGYYYRGNFFSVAIVKSGSPAFDIDAWENTVRSPSAVMPIHAHIGTRKWLYIIPWGGECPGGLKRQLRLLQATCREHRLQIGISLPFQKVGEVREAYHQADLMGDQAFISGVQGLHIYNKRYPLFHDRLMDLLPDAVESKQLKALTDALLKYRTWLNLEALTKMYNKLAPLFAKEGGEAMGKEELLSAFGGFEPLVLHLQGREELAEKGQEAHVTNKIIKEIIDDISVNFAQKHMISGFAKKHHLHPNYLSQLFKLTTGKSFTAHLFEIRMKRALELIDQGDMEFQEICEHVGYEDYVHFSKQFKKYTGDSPVFYKKKHRHR